MSRDGYCGRFAPTPTGPLHVGSLLAATASYLEARTRGGRWQVRIDDLDPPRTVPGAAETILATLARLGFAIDAPVVYQSARRPAHEAALERLIERRAVYQCQCSRAEILETVGPPETGTELRYPGTCRERRIDPDRPYAWRLRVPETAVAFEDAIRGRVEFDIGRSVGDFVVRRRDALIAYQLAVVVDDAAAGVTDVVRGADLLDSTARQLLVYRALDLPAPAHAHVPLLIDGTGRKLGKSTGAPPVDALRPTEALWRALDLLRQCPPQALRGATLEQMWAWAHEHWSLAALHGIDWVSFGP